MQSFLTALHHFTAVGISRMAGHPIDATVLVWLPVIGILAVTFYVPFASLYFMTLLPSVR